MQMEEEGGGIEDLLWQEEAKQPTQPIKLWIMDCWMYFTFLSEIKTFYINRGNVTGMYGIASLTSLHRHCGADDVGKYQSFAQLSTLL